MIIFPNCTIQDIVAAAEHLVEVGVAQRVSINPPRYRAVLHEHMSSQAGAYWEVFEAFRAGRTIDTRQR